MSWYDEINEKVLDFYSGEYKKGLLGKKCLIKLSVYPSHIEGIGFVMEQGELANESDFLRYNIKKYVMYM